MACPVCKGECRHTEILKETQEVAAALSHALEGKQMRFALVFWGEDGTAALASNAHQVTVRHQLARVLNAELEKDFREFATVNAQAEGTH